MAIKKCDFCKKNKVPVGGQCSECGMIDGLNRPPTNAEFLKAREINKKNNMPLFHNVDMALLEAEAEIEKSAKRNKK